MNLYVALFLIVIKAIYDGLALGGRKTLAGAIEFIYTACITIFIFMVLGGLSVNREMDYLIYHLIGFLLVRYAIFDFILNLFADLDLLYIGKTKLYDKFLGWFFTATGFPKGHFLVFTRAIALFMGIVFLLK